jgi:uncharacterized protein (DUF111 family)
MKKSRPGQLLQVLSPTDLVDRLTRLIFEETTTIGIRRYAVDRTVLEREFVEVQTEYGTIKVKVSKMEGEVVNFTPEYEDCARIARERNVPLKKVQAMAVNSYLQKAK